MLFKAEKSSTSILIRFVLSSERPPSNMASPRPKRDVVEVDSLELDAGQNYTVITAAGEAANEAEVSADNIEAEVEGGTVIEVPVAYTDLQSSETQAFIIQEAEDENRDDNDCEGDVADPEDKDEDDSDDVDSDPDFDPNDGHVEVTKVKGRKVKPQRNIEVEKCSICGTNVADLAIHILNMHSGDTTSPVKAQRSSVVKSEVEDRKRSRSPVQNAFGLKPRKRAYTKGKYQQIKPVLRFPCDLCKHVSKTSDQLKKHMITGCPVKGMGTSWMFCGECEYATRVEEELVNHVKMHQLFSILKDDMEDKEEESDEEDEIDEEAIIRAATGGKGLPGTMGNYDPNPMSCGDCDFETHYENELFDHLKMHLRKDANIHDDTDSEVRIKLKISCA